MRAVVRSYGQYWALARGLDVVSDRWVLPIVRAAQQSRRYGELTHGLPGIATNLLAERLRTMQASGLVDKTDDDLHDVVSAIAGWASPLMDHVAEDDTFRSHWIAQPSPPALFPNGTLHVFVGGDREGV